MVHTLAVVGTIIPWLTNVGQDAISFKIDTLLVLLIAIDLHELGHALVADWLGDDTPRAAGHMTLNPFRKMDQFGIIMLVLLSLTGRGFTYGFTPVNEARLRQRTEFGPAIVALAGPLMNLLIAILAAIPLANASLGNDGFTVFGSQPAFDFLSLLVTYNLVLFVLNLIPLPPLDGWTILSAFFTPKTRFELRQFVIYGPFILLLLYVLDPQIHIISNTVYPLVEHLADLLSNL